MVCIYVKSMSLLWFFAANVLQYLDLGSNAAQLSMEDDSFSSPIMVPGQIPFFNENYSSLFVSSTC